MNKQISLLNQLEHRRKIRFETRLERFLGNLDNLKTLEIEHRYSLNRIVLFPPYLQNANLLVMFTGQNKHPVNLKLFPMNEAI